MIDIGGGDKLVDELRGFLARRPLRCTLEEWLDVRRTPGTAAHCLLDVSVPLLVACLASALDEAHVLEVARLLLDAGVSPHVTDSARRSALWWAVHTGRLAVAAHLVERGGAVRVQTYRAGLDALLNSPWQAVKGPSSAPQLVFGGGGPVSGKAVAGTDVGSAGGSPLAPPTTDALPAEVPAIQARLEFVARHLHPRALARPSPDLRWADCDTLAPAAYVIAKLLCKAELAAELALGAQSEEAQREAAAFSGWLRDILPAARFVLQLCLLHGAEPLPASLALPEGASAEAAAVWRMLAPTATARAAWTHMLHRAWLPPFREAARALLLCAHRGFPVGPAPPTGGAGPLPLRAASEPDRAVALHLPPAAVEAILAHAAADVDEARAAALDGPAVGRHARLEQAVRAQGWGDVRRIYMGIGHSGVLPAAFADMADALAIPKQKRKALVKALAHRMNQQNAYILRVRQGALRAKRLAMPGDYAEAARPGPVPSAASQTETPSGEPEEEETQMPSPSPSTQTGPSPKRRRTAPASAAGQPSPKTAHQPAHARKLPRARGLHALAVSLPEPDGEEEEAKLMAHVQDILSGLRCLRLLVLHKYGGASGTAALERLAQQLALTHFAQHAQTVGSTFDVARCCPAGVLGAGGSAWKSTAGPEMLPWGSGSRTGREPAAEYFASELSVVALWDEANCLHWLKENTHLPAGGPAGRPGGGQQRQQRFQCYWLLIRVPGVRLVVRCEAAEQYAPSAAATAAEQRRARRQEDKAQRSYRPPPVSAAQLAARHPEDAATVRALAKQMWAAQQAGEESAARAEEGGGLFIANCSAGRAGANGGADAASPAPLPARFTDAELMRFALLKGYARARGAGERAAALAAAAEQVAHTAAWLAHHSFASAEELARFGDLVWWEAAPDAEGRPVLRIRLAAAVRRCRGAEALHFANAIITQMEQAVRECLVDGGPEQVCVVMDCSGGNALLAARISWVFKAVSLTLNHHYPARLHRLDLVELPVMLQWLVAVVHKLVAPETREKIHVHTT
eukprot:scaffold11.g3874.t1